jgi:formylglycine-generating enzyme required for sulfatase activity
MKARNILAAVLLLAMVSAASADRFGMDGNQFTIDFVTISGSNPTSGITAGAGFTFTGVANDYRMGTLEITNDQWNKFKAAYGTVMGSPSSAYFLSSHFTGTNLPTDNVSWYEAAQFVNWLNTSTGHQAAYKFNGEQGEYTLDVWGIDKADGTNLYRHKDAFYYLATENEWVKAGYWNGTTLQNYATKTVVEHVAPGQGNGTSGTGWNYIWRDKYATNPQGPWNVGSGSEELNGTYDMMGNIWEWMESPYSDTNYGTGSDRGLRGGVWAGPADCLQSGLRDAYSPPYAELYLFGFRVASEVPEPATLSLLALGGLALIRRCRKQPAWRCSDFRSGIEPTRMP